MAPERLSSAERGALDTAVVRYASVASLWEIAILMDLGRLAGEPRLLDLPDVYTLLTRDAAIAAYGEAGAATLVLG